MAENLDTRYAPQPSLQEGFIDKQTGLPLTYGLVFFYKNNNRNVLKPVFELQEALPGGPVTYVALPNPVVLSGVGTIQNQNGDDVIPYFYPYDANGNIELYYIIVMDQFGTVQFTREAFPNIGQGIVPPGFNFADNYIPNGQFLINNPPASFATMQYTMTYPGLGTNKVIDVAPGGWTFQVNNTSTATDIVTFFQFPAYISIPSQSPRYQIRIQRTSASIDTVCDLRIRFMDVNKFNAADNGDFTFVFNAATGAGTLNGVTVQLIKYFGTNADGTATSPSEDNAFQSSAVFNFTTANTQFAAVGSFPINTGKIVGNNNDDFIELAVRFPADFGVTFDVRLTDFMLIQGDLSSAQLGTLEFPNTTNGEFVLQALSNLAPTTRSDTNNNYYQEDGSNLYLPIVMTKSGFTYDDSSVGDIVAKTSLVDFNSTSISTKGNELLCDGSQYPVNGYSPLGIPYRRLFNKLIDTTNPLLQTPPPFGGGTDYVNVLDYTVDNPLMFLIMTNKITPQTPAGNGLVSPGFSYATPNLGAAATLGFTARANTNEFIVVRGNVNGPVVSIPVDGTGGLITLTTAANANVTNSVIFITGSAFMTAAALSAGGGNPAKYISISNTTTQYSFWFNVAGEAANGPGTRIQVNLEPTLLSPAVTAVLANAINGFQTDIVLPVAEGAIPQSSYFTFTANGTTYNVWYNKNNLGTAPVLPNLIEVNIVTGDTVPNIAFKTTVAINSQFFAVPDLRGLFLRGYDPNSVYDSYPYERTSLLYNQNYRNFNTWEVDTFAGHFHLPVPPVATGFIVRPGGGLGGGAGGDMVEQSQTGETGYFETRPVNQNVVWAIKY